MPTTPSATKRRAPKGVVTDKPVAVRFLPVEREELKELAAEQQRTLSAMTRIATMRGVAVMKAERRKA